MRTRLRFSLTVLSLSITLSATQAQAQLNVACKTDPIIFGQVAGFGLEGEMPNWSRSGNPIWERRWVAGDCDTGFQGVGTDIPLTVTIPLSYPGTLTVRCNAVYVNRMTSERKTFVLTKTITVPPPDDVRILKLTQPPHTGRDGACSPGAGRAGGVSGHLQR